MTDMRKDFITVVFDKSADSFATNPLHIKSEFGNVVAIQRGDALATHEAYEQAKMPPHQQSSSRCFRLDR